jgi:hypothetical protein
MRMPVLVFEVPAGMRGVEEWAFPLMLAGSPLAATWVRNLLPQQGRAMFDRLASDKAYRDQYHAQIRDSLARAFFQKLANDDQLQAELLKLWQETAVPLQRDNWDRFRRAFSDSLETVRLDVRAISGYEYRDSPATIAPHIRRFLGRVNARAGAPRRKPPVAPTLSGPAR